MPDSNKGQQASEGYIIYRIRPVSTVQAGDSIHNTASIYFDFNLPVATNLQVTYIRNRSASPPVQPVIAGLNAAYCGNAGPAAFTMTNFPDTTAGTVIVTDSVDNKPWTIGAGASCSILLRGLSVGTHTVKVTSTNAGGASSYSQSFSVVAASAPVMGVNATYTIIPTTAAMVTRRTIRRC